MTGMMMASLNNMIPIFRSALFCLALLMTSFAPTGANSVDPSGCDTTSDTMLVSVKTGGEPVEYLASGHALSDDARYIVFQAWDSTIGSNDTNNMVDVFVHDRETCTTTLVSRPLPHIPSLGDNTPQSKIFITGDGRYIIFSSSHNNLVPDDNNLNNDIFVYDQQTKIIERLFYGIVGNETNADYFLQDISSDGRFILISSYADNVVPNDTNNTMDVFLLDRLSNTVEQISLNSAGEEGDNWSGDSAVSEDGRFVAFLSAASNLMPVSTTDQLQAFLRDRAEGTTTLVSVNSTGESADSMTNYIFISDDGRYVGLDTYANNFVDTNQAIDSYLYDRVTGNQEWVSPRSDSPYYAHAWNISADERYIVLETPDPMEGVDTNGWSDIFLFDRLTKIYRRQSRLPSGDAPDNATSLYGVMTPNAQYILFQQTTDVGTPENIEYRKDLYLTRVEMPGVDLSLVLQLQGRPTRPDPTWITEVHVILHQHGNMAPLFDQFFSTDTQGILKIDNLPSGNYTLWIKVTNTLALSQSITLTVDSLDISAGILPAGDTNGDNIINLTDFSLLASSFGTQFGEHGYNARADFNGDGQITLHDFSLLATNFGGAGDPSP